MKYIVIKAKFNGGMDIEIPFLFPNTLVHEVIAENMIAALDEHYEGEKVVVSAGDYYTMNGECSGGSDTLKMESREQDSSLIQFSDYGAGFI